MTSGHVLGRSIPRARKPHRCSTCLGPISAGDTYTRFAILNDGRVSDWLECDSCQRDWVAQYVGDWASADGWGSDTANEWATDRQNHGTPDEQRAAIAFLKRWEVAS